MSNPGLINQQNSLGTSPAPLCAPRAPGWADALRQTHPELSAASPLARWQRVTLALVLVALPLGFWFDADTTAMLGMALLTPVFLCVVLLRATAIATTLTTIPPPASAPPARSESLPVYSILVPLYREAHMAQALLAALDRLDWPIAKRDILIITEADDAETRHAFEAAIAGHPGIRIVIVPPGEPRTKPRALMYALPESIGDFVVVYDAEDEPEPKQLHQAYRHFQAAPPGLGCIQAHLNVYNPRANSRSNIAHCSTRSCPPSNASAFPFLWAVHPIIFAAKCWKKAAAGTPTTSLKMPISASALPAKAGALRC